MAIWASIFSIAVIVSVSKASVFTGFVYKAGLFVPNMDGGKPFSAPFRLEIPYSGALLFAASLMLVGVIIAFLMYLYQNERDRQKSRAHTVETRRCHSDRRGRPSRGRNTFQRRRSRTAKASVRRGPDTIRYRRQNDR